MNEFQMLRFDWEWKEKEIFFAEKTFVVFCFPVRPALFSHEQVSEISMKSSFFVHLSTSNGVFRVRGIAFPSTQSEVNGDERLVSIERISVRRSSFDRCEYWHRSPNEQTPLSNHWKQGRLRCSSRRISRGSKRRSMFVWRRSTLCSSSHFDVSDKSFLCFECVVHSHDEFSDALNQTVVVCHKSHSSNGSPSQTKNQFSRRCFLEVTTTVTTVDERNKEERCLWISSF